MSTAQEILQKIKGSGIFAKMDIDSGIQPNGIEWVNVSFGDADTEQAEQATAVLSALGFKVSLFGGSKRFAPNFPSLREKFETMSDEEKAAATKLFEELATGR